MKQLFVLLLAAALSLFAGSAYAAGADLSVGACPGNTGAANTATLDCAGGGTVTLLVTFAPIEAIADLVAISAMCDLNVAGDVTTSAADFWDFASANAAAFSGSQKRPSQGCANYADTWAADTAGFSCVAHVLSPSQVRIIANAYRSSPLSVAANQRLFGMQLTIDAATSVESGHGTVHGCTLAACVLLLEADPETYSGAHPTPLTTFNVFGSRVGLNGEPPYGGLCGDLPAVRHTWGQLKSLYR